MNFLNKRKSLISNVRFKSAGSKRLPQAKDMLFGQAFTASLAGVSDFLQPLGNVTFALLLISIFVTLTLIILYLLKDSLREKVIKYFTVSISLMILSGLLYSSQDETNSQTGVLAGNFSSIASLQSSLGVIESELLVIKESTLRTEELVGDIAENTKENVEQTRQLNETITNTSEIIANKLDDINESFNQISKLGGLIANPERPEEHYHNLRVYEDKGDYLNARGSYNQYFSFNLNYIDPHLRYQTFLKIQEGRAGAREAYNSFFENDQRVVIQYLKILLFNAPYRTDLLKDFTSKNPDFAPAYYELSKDFSPTRTGKVTLENTILELEALEEFIRLNNQGKFIRYFLDKALAAEWIKYAEERLKVLTSQLNQIKETYFDDGTIFLETNYRNGIREGEELVYKNKNDLIDVYDGLIVNHSSRGRTINIKVSDSSWYEDKNILIKRNFYNKGELEKSIDISYYSTGEILKIQTSVPASEEALEKIRSKIEIEKIRIESGYSFDGGEGLKDLEYELKNAMEIKGLYKYYYKNGQIEDEGIYENGETVSYSFFSKDGMLEETGSFKNYFSISGVDFRFLDGPYERYHDNGQIMMSGRFKEGNFLAPYKVYYDDGSVYLEKNSQGEYKKFDKNKRLSFEVVPAKCEEEKTYTTVSNSKGYEKAAYACFIKKSIDSEGNTEKETISIRPFNSKPNCLIPTRRCQGVSPEFIGNFFEQ
tara:strand:+ start:516 stop:2651 length:2136 start_codon:yes stop_codon:yes gene_type:complete